MKIAKYLRTLRNFLTKPQVRFDILAGLGFFKHVSDERFLKKAYKLFMGKKPDFENPKNYTEKLQWLKMYDHRPEYTKMVDKFAVKQFVAERIGEEYVVPLLGVWERPEEIDFEKLPEQFVLKATHDSGGIVICKDKSSFDKKAAVEKMNAFLKRNYYTRNREWPYKNVPHRIIAEKYMEDSTFKELRDYKFFTFGGEPKVLYIAQGRGRGEETVADFFDMDFNHLPFTIDHDTAPVLPEKPEGFEVMKALARKLSEGTPQLRVDFYEVDGKVYFGEMTFFHCSGLNPFHPEKWDRIFGDWIELPDKRM